MSSKGVSKKKVKPSKTIDATKKLAEKIKQQALKKQQEKESSSSTTTSTPEPSSSSITTIDPDAELKFKTFKELNLVRIY